MVVSGEGSHKGEAYKLPATDQDRERRNFPGYVKHEYDKDLMNAVSHDGTTNSKSKSGKWDNKVEPDMSNRHISRRFN